MAIPISSITYFIAAAVIFCFAAVSIISSTSTDHNSIKVTSDGQHHLQISTDDHHQDQAVSFSPFFPSSAKIEAIYQFGDSMSDTGNFIREMPLSTFAKLPYGQTFFHKPTGRCSDGLLIIDYFSKSLKLPFLDPYLNKDGNFSHGANFAVAGATALNCSTLAIKGIATCVTHSSLLVQLDWFKSHLGSTVSDRKKKLAKALVMMGEIGGNDYNWAFFEGKSIDKIYEMVPEVVQAIKAAVKEVVKLGATRVVVPGNFPIGCMTIYLDLFKTNDSTMYDQLQCLRYLNDFAKFHNDKLQEVIGELQWDHPNTTILYADYFSAFKYVLQHATSLGFDKDTMQKACCINCARDGSSVCVNPNKYINWDLVHLTQHTYQIMAKRLFNHLFRDISYANTMTSTQVRSREYALGRGCFFLFLLCYINFFYVLG